MIMFRDRRFWTKLCAALLLAIVSATPVLMSSAMDRGYEIAKLSLAEPLAFLALASILMANGWRRGSQASREARTASLCFATFLVLASISTVLSEHPGIAFFGGYYRREGLLAWAAYAAFFFAVLAWARERTWLEIGALLDLLLLASVIPCVYAVQQALRLDFFHVANIDLTRPNGTLGNPIFLGADCAILLPITAVRCWGARRRAPELTLWLMLALLQATGLLISQSRGPLLACILGSVLLAGLGAGYKRSRGTFVAFATLLVAVAAVVLAVNTLASARRWAQDQPVLSRLVYNLKQDAGQATSLASRSTAARLGIWQAANETFLEAPAASKWIGFGPESAYTHYFPNLPDAVMRVDGYWQSNSYDRFHADTLDMGLSFGLAGWVVYCAFFGAVFLAAGRALFGFTGNKPSWLFVLLPLVGGPAAAVLAIVAGLPATIAPAIGLSIGFVWLLFFLVYSWRVLPHGLPENARSRPEHWALLAGLTASLLVFWMDAQVNIPVMTTRLVSFGVAALILAVASTMSQALREKPAPPTGAFPWGIAFPLVAACASFLPAVIIDASMRAQETERWWLSGIPIGLLLAFGAFDQWLRIPAGPRRLRDLGHWMLALLGLVAMYLLCHWALIPRAGPVFSEREALRLAAAASLGSAYMLLFCLALVWHGQRGSGAWDEAGAARPKLVAALPAFALAMLAAVFAWTAIKADVGSTFAMWTASKQPDVSDRILLEAIAAMPHERQYQRQRIFAHLGRAMDDIKRLGAASGDFAWIRASLDVAERQARDSVRQFPDDPWIVLALANALQIRALPVIRPLAPAEGRQAALEADELFARAYELFPNQPLLLRNWAQLRFNEGDIWGAYRLLDRMESIIPNEVEPYSERIAFARQLGDSHAIRETMERAGKSLDPAKFAQLLAVAPIQQ